MSEPWQRHVDVGLGTTMLTITLRLFAAGSLFGLWNRGPDALALFVRCADQAASAAGGLLQQVADGAADCTVTLGVVLAYFAVAWLLLRESPPALVPVLSRRGERLAARRRVTR